MSMNFVANVKGEKGDPGTPGPFVNFPAGVTDFNDMTTEGVYKAGFGDADVLNRPPDANANYPFVLTVYELTTSGRVYQRYEQVQATNMRAWVRIRGSSSSAYSDWVERGG